MAEIYTKTGFVPDSAPEPIGLDAFLAAPGNVTSITLQPDARLEALIPYLGQLALIAVAFPKFSDGRGYSLAARLRLHHGYQGRLRATGDILTDQTGYFFRQGFDELAISNAPTLARLKSGVAPAFDLFMQADVSGKEHGAAKGHAYSWRRSVS